MTEHVAPDLATRSLSDLLALTGRVAVVTGGAKGIGRAIAARLAEAGATVVVGDLDTSAGATRLDVTDSGSIDALADLVVTDHGSLDIWVNCAGIFPLSDPLAMTADEWDRVVDTNLRGTFFAAQAAARRMIAGERGGVIVNIASTSSYRGRAALPHYSSAKHGVLGLTKSLALAFGPMGIRVVAVAPVFTRDEPPGSPAQPVPPTMSIPLGRPGLPDDVARAVVFCASDLAAFVTGSCVDVDGGYLAG